MRIRKNGRHLAPSCTQTPPAPPPPLSRTPISEQQQACELNQSPWDVIAFTPQPDFSFPDQYLVAVKDYIPDNSGGGESSTVFERFTSSKKQHVKKEYEDEYDYEEEESKLFSRDVDNEKKKKMKKKKKMIEKDYTICIKSDGKGWQCKNEAEEGYSLCEHHLIKLKSYTHNQSTSRKSHARKAVAVSPKKTTRHRVASDSPMEFYYYSGFGPWWGRKRGGGETESIKKENTESESATDVAQTSSPTHDTLESSHVDVDDGGDDIEVDSSDSGGKKRPRKPIKARSLKSLL